MTQPADEPEEAPPATQPAATQPVPQPAAAPEPAPEPAAEPTPKAAVPKAAAAPLLKRKPMLVGAGRGVGAAAEACWTPPLAWHSPDEELLHPTFLITCSPWQRSRPRWLCGRGCCRAVAAVCCVQATDLLHAGTPWHCTPADPVAPSPPLPLLRAAQCQRSPVWRSLLPPLPLQSLLRLQSPPLRSQVGAAGVEC